MTPVSETGARSEAGFILPFVLVVLSCLALIAAAAFGAVSKAVSVMTALEEGSAEDAALATAEAQAAFAFLTSTPVSEGLWLGAPAVAADDPSGEPTVADRLAAGTLDPGAVASDDYWRGNGAARSVFANGRRITVQYRDAGGLFALASANEDRTAVFLELLGLSRDAASEMAARIADYEDPDHVRRFRGAERADYRLFSRPPPTNSPLRNPEELGRVLGFFEVAPPGFWREVLDFATTDQGVLLAYAAPPRLLPLASAVGADDGGLDAISSQTRRPSGRARFLLHVTGEGRSRTRAVDIRRPPPISQAPFQRFMVYETTEIAQRAPSLDVENAPVLYPDFDRTPQ